MVLRLIAVLVGWIFLLGAPGCSETGVVAPPADDDDITGEPDDDDTGDDDDDDDDVTGDDDTTGDDDDSMWDDAELVVYSPESGDFFPLGTPVLLDAEVVDGDGQPMEWDEILWTTDQDEDFEFIGTVGEVEDFPVGEHVVKAETELPNGDRLTYAVGGILVQHEYSGVYSGTVNVGINIEIQGYPIAGNCVGAVDFIVDPYGELLEGTGACIASLAGYLDLDLDLVIDGEIDGGAIDGQIGISVMGWFDLPTAYTGSFVASDEMEGSFDGEILGVTMVGEISAHRVALGP